VVDATTGIAGAYATLLLHQAGADVVWARPPTGAAAADSSGSGSGSGAHVVVGDAAVGDDPELPSGSPLFTYLRQGQRAAAIDRDLPGFLASGADVVLVSPAIGERADVSELCAARPNAIVVSITPYGLEGPYRDRPASDLTLQADSGALAIRGNAGEAPVQMGGRTLQWLAGAYGAVAALALWRARRGGLVDLSVAEVANTGGANFMDVFHAIEHGAEAEPPTPPRAFEVPSIERTSDGWVGVNTNAPHQAANFLRMIGRDDLADAGQFLSFSDRLGRVDEWQPMVDAWTSARTTAEVIDAAVAHHVPVAPVTNGRTVTELDHVAARHNLVDEPTGAFKFPRRPWRLDGDVGDAPLPAPAVAYAAGAGIEPAQSVRPASDAAADSPAEGADLRDDDGAVAIPLGDAVGDGRSPLAWRQRSTEDPAAGFGATPRSGGATEAVSAGARPLEGVRVLDITTWWAGPAATALLAALGAEVIHVEGPSRMDGARMVGASFFDRPQWWERSPFFLSANNDKRDVVLDLATERGRELALELVGEVDAVVENFTPRVMEKLGLGWDAVHAANPRAVLVRMPAFGLDGPWRDRPGFAQNIEQASGLAWITGQPDDQPRIQRGPCDPNGGIHAAIGLLVALDQRDRTGEGCLVEASLFDAALALASEPIVEWGAHGVVMERTGNRSAGVAPQGVYRCAGPGGDAWLALTVASDEQWPVVATLIGRPDLATDPALATEPDRRERHDELDAVLSDWAAYQRLDDAVAALTDAGVPAAPARDPRIANRHPQYRARGYHQMVDHPVAGTLPLPTLPFHLSGAGPWIRKPAPTFGQHTDEVLVELLGLGPEQIADLWDDGVVADRPTGM
jgi:crotonobetainyl-CoA:carnitine CoA-transferase CaiB-like acyl-CoA transferase